MLGPFAKMTAGRNAAFKRRLALRGFVIALIAALASATLGASTLERWGISVAALTLTAGIILFLVALQPVLRQYEARDGGPDASPDAAPPTVSSLAFSPLAFPTIVTPYGIAVLIIAVALSPRGIAGILSLVGIVLLLDLLAMLVAERVLKTPFLAATFAIAGAVLGVLQMALGVQAVANAVRVLAAGGAA
jgi:multiple antibiotic resistance protein